MLIVYRDDPIFQRIPDSLKGERLNRQDARTATRWLSRLLRLSLDYALTLTTDFVFFIPSVTCPLFGRCLAHNIIEDVIDINEFRGWWLSVLNGFPRSVSVIGRFTQRNISHHRVEKADEIDHFLYKLMFNVWYI